MEPIARAVRGEIEGNGYVAGRGALADEGDVRFVHAHLFDVSGWRDENVRAVHFRLVGYGIDSTLHGRKCAVRAGLIYEIIARWDNRGIKTERGAAASKNAAERQRPCA